MKSLFDHIETAKGKPHHVRKQIAFGAATAGAGFIALVWFVQALASGVLAIQTDTSLDNSGQGQVIVAPENGTQNLAGAAAAIQNASAPAHIEIVDVASSSKPTKQVEQTILPF